MVGDLQLQLADLARHFWSMQTAAYVREKDIEIESLATRHSAVAESEKWLLAALNNQPILPSVTLGNEDTILAYPIARLLIMVLQSKLLSKRFATVVSKYAGFVLNREEDSRILTLAMTAGNFYDEGFHLSYERVKQEEDISLGRRATAPIVMWRVFFTDYVRASQGFHEPRWKLVNRFVKAGWVHLSKQDLVRLLEEALKERIYKTGMKMKDQLPPLEKLPDRIRGIAVSLSQALKRMETRNEWSTQPLEAGGELKEDLCPGCVRKIINDLETNVSVGHEERLALVFFLSNIGLDSEDVIKFFSKAPDFDKARTRYYVEHAMGMTGGHTKYRSFGCKKLKSYRMCWPQHDWCRTGMIGPRILRGPVHFYRAASWVQARKKRSN